VEKEEALSEPPKRRCAKFIGTRRPWVIPSANVEPI